MAARHVLNECDATDMVAFGVSQLAETESPSVALYELANWDPNDGDTWERLEAVLEEMGVALPSRDEAVWIVLRHEIRMIVAGRTDPLEGVRWVGELDLGVAPREYVGDSHGAAELVGAYHSLDDLDYRGVRGRKRRREERALKAHIVEIARAWLAEHG